jgi:hypothetical protein
MKGLTGLFGSQQLADQFLALEDAAEAGDPARMEGAFAGLDGNVKTAGDELRGWLKSRRPAAG